MAQLQRFLDKFKSESESGKISPSSNCNSDELVKFQSDNATEMAAKAAVARLPKRKIGQASKTSFKRLREEIRRETAAIQRENVVKINEMEEKDIEMPNVIRRTLYRCIVVHPEPLPYENISHKIKKYIYENLATEPEKFSALMIHSFNDDSDKVKECTEIIAKYIENLANKPEEEKFRKIRINNQIFQERVNTIEGSHEFIRAIGFEKETSQNVKNESFYIFQNDIDAKVINYLKSARNMLLTTKALKPKLDRDLKVFHPCPHAHRMDIPSDFYAVTSEELKREQQRLTENVHRFETLRTSKMRHRDSIKELRRYRYTCVRTRIPDGKILQGTFKSTEKLSDVVDFLRSHLADSLVSYELLAPPNVKLDLKGHSTLAELGLVPAVILTLTIDKEMYKEYQSGNETLLKPGLQNQVKELT